MSGAAVGEVRFADWLRGMKPSPLQQALARTDNPEILSLALGLPDPDLFPMEALEEACARVLASNRSAFQYCLPTSKLKLAICRHMADRGVECIPDQVFLTMGAQQGLSLIARLLLDQGSTILEESLSYTGYQQVVEPYCPRIITIPTTAPDGIDVDVLELQLSKMPRPAFLYMMADGHNPLGVTVPPANRERIAALAREHQVPLIEDDPYGFLEYDGKPLPPIRAWESDWIYYVGSFSKLLAPSLRTGWLLVPHALIQPLSIIKEASDINMSNFAQCVVTEFLEMGVLPAHVDRLRREYGARRRAMDAVLRTEFPSYCRWQIPGSGIFFWIDLPDRIDATRMLDRAIRQERVAFIPAAAFSRGERNNGMRLNFSKCNSRFITEAVRRIGKVICSET